MSSSVFVLGVPFFFLCSSYRQFTDWSILIKAGTGMFCIGFILLAFVGFLYLLIAKFFSLSAVHLFKI